MAELNAIDVFGENLTIKQLFFDASHPIGSTYTQYPQQDSPQTLFDNAGVTSTWEVVNYDGAFFRAQGTNANDFIEKTGVLSKQSDLVKSHTHDFTPNGTISDGEYKFTGSAVTSGVNSRGHIHTINDGNTSSSGTTTTAGIRHSGSTGEMSQNSKGWFSIAGGKDGYQNNGDWNNHYGDYTNVASGNVTLSLRTATKAQNSSILTSASGLPTFSIDVSHTHSLPSSYIYGQTDDESSNHTHSVTASGTISVTTNPTFSGSAGTTSSNDTNAIENRPVNYTIRVWKRTA